MNKKEYFEKSNNFIFMKKRIIYFIIFVQQIFLIYLLIINYKLTKNNNISLNHKISNLYIQSQLNNNYTIIEKIKLDYNNCKFAILRRTSCPTCGLFSNYIVHLGCIREYLSKGYIPIIDLSSFSNLYNGFNSTSLTNPW